MKTKILGKLFWCLAGFCVWLLVGQKQPVVDTPSQYQEPEQSLVNQLPLEFVSVYQLAKAEKQLAKKQQLINSALKLAEQLQIINKSVLADLHFMLGALHEQRWHYQYAIASYQRSQSLVFDKRLDRRVKQLKQHLVKSSGERNFKQEYIATRNSGPSKVLKGKILVAYVFIDDGRRTRWTDRDIKNTASVLQSVQDWQQNQASFYQIEKPEFINQEYLIKRNPHLKMLASLSHKSSRYDVEKFVAIVMRHLGAKDVNDFLTKKMAEVDAEQAMLVFHSNFEKRSFARRCGYTHERTYYVKGIIHVEKISRCNDEYVMLMDKVARNRWDKLHYVQAHEALHLFGADDLYNISDAKDYAITDIMNYQSRYLDDSLISPITAYAIGWLDKPPNAPFTILDK